MKAYMGRVLIPVYDKRQIVFSSDCSILAKRLSSVSVHYLFTDTTFLYQFIVCSLRYVCDCCEVLRKCIWCLTESLSLILVSTEMFVT